MPILQSQGLQAWSRVSHTLSSTPNLHSVDTILKESLLSFCKVILKSNQNLCRGKYSVVQVMGFLGNCSRCSPALAVLRAVRARSPEPRMQPGLPGERGWNLLMLGFPVFTGTHVFPIVACDVPGEHRQRWQFAGLCRIPLQGPGVDHFPSDRLQGHITCEGFRNQLKGFEGEISWQAQTSTSNKHLQ